MIDPEMHLTPLQRELYELMSEISEDCWHAGWLIGNEFALWDAIVTGNRAYGQGCMDEAQLARCKALSEQIGGWIEWRDDEHGLPHGEWGPYFIATPDWLEKFAKDKAGRDALGAAIPKAPPPLPDPHWPREYFGAVPSGAYTADQMHAYIRAERAARQEAQRQLYAERERLYKLVSDEQVKASRLHAEIEALRRGEFICGKCGLRKDAETSGPAPF